MRSFVISDIHGNGKLYDSVINFLNNINKNEEVELYIVGDLIDRGPDSARILLDVYDRIINQKDFPIFYLAGNHELMMYNNLHSKRKDFYEFDNWLYRNGGDVTLKELNKLLNEEELTKLIDFIGTLDIYKLMDYVIDNKNIVLTHSKCPKKLLYNCHLMLKYNTCEIEECLWDRNYYDKINGNRGFFIILGHTPVDNDYGFEYVKSEKYINIDGGSALYDFKNKSFNHFPLVEIANEKLNILTFNDQNEIVYANAFKNGDVSLLSNDEMSCYESYLKTDSYVRKLK